MSNAEASRVCFPISPKLYQMDQRVKVSTKTVGYDATGPYWVIGHIQIVSGSLSFLVDGSEVRAPSDCFLMVMPQHSVVSVVTNRAETVNRAIFSRELQIKNLPQHAIAFPCTRKADLNSVAELESMLMNTDGKRHISRCTHPAPASLRVLKFIGENFQSNINLCQLARLAKMSPEALCRMFKRNWSKSPIQFRNWLRVMDSFRKISEGVSITETAYEVGFSDLSRFHKNFKSLVGNTPLALYLKSKNAKN